MGKKDDYSLSFSASELHDFLEEYAEELVAREWRIETPETCMHFMYAQMQLVGHDNVKILTGDGKDFLVLSYGPAGWHQAWHTHDIYYAEAEARRRIKDTETREMLEFERAREPNRKAEHKCKELWLRPWSL